MDVTLLKAIQQMHVESNGFESHAVTFKKLKHDLTESGVLGEIMQEYHKLISSYEYMKYKRLEMMTFGSFVSVFGYDNVFSASSVSANTPASTTGDIDFIITYTDEKQYDVFSALAKKNGAKFMEIRGTPGTQSEHRVWATEISHGGLQIEIEIKFRQKEMAREVLKLHAYIDDVATEEDKAIVSIGKRVTKKEGAVLYQKFKMVAYNYFAVMGGSKYVHTF